MKKTINVIICVVLALSVFVGCGIPQQTAPGSEPTTEQEQGEQAAMKQAMSDTDEFCRVLIENCPDNIAQFRIQNSFEETYGSFWFELEYASVLYSNGAVFAIIDVGLYPEYAESGSAVFEQSGETTVTDIEVVRSEYNDYSLLYAPDDRPTDAVINSFIALPENAISGYGGGGDILQDFFYRSGSWEWLTYELMATSKVNGDEDTALLYIKENDWLLDGYPIEVPASKLQELSEIVDKYDIKDWKESYEVEEEIADGDGFVLSMQYDNAYHISTGYMSYPPNYKEAQSEISQFFSDLRYQRTTEIQEQNEAERLNNVVGIYAIKFSYGNYVTGATVYEIETTDAGLSLSYGDLGVTIAYGDDEKQWIIEDVLMPDDAGQKILDIYNEHDAFSWYGYDEKDDGSNDFVFLNDLFTEQDENLVHFTISGVGHSPDGWQAFQDDLSAYLNSILGI